MADLALWYVHSRKDGLLALTSFHVTSTAAAKSFSLQRPSPSANMGLERNCCRSARSVEDLHGSTYCLPPGSGSGEGWLATYAHPLLAHHLASWFSSSSSSVHSAWASWAASSGAMRAKRNLRRRLAGAIGCTSACWSTGFFFPHSFLRPSARSQCN